MSQPRSIAWSLSGQIGMTIAAIASTIVLARLLTPADYGAFAFATVIYALVQWLLQMGMGNYILREAHLTHAKIETAFAATCLQGIAAFAIVAVAAPIAGWFTHSATVGWVTFAVAAVPFLAAPEAVADALWLRNGNYSTIATLQVAKAAMQTIVSVGCEWIWHLGAFSLVAGLLALALTSFTAALVSMMLRQRLRPRRDPAHWREIRAFGGRSLLLTIAQIGSMRVPDLLLGRLLGLDILGHFNRAGGALDLVARTVSASIVRATAPRFYADVNQGRPPADAIADFCATLLFFVWPALAGVAVLSAPMIHLLYGPQWDVAGRILPALCLVVAIEAARTGGMEIFLIKDRLGANAKLEFVRSIYVIALTVVAARFGLAAVLWARVIESLITLGVYTVAMQRFDALPWRQAWRVFGVNAVLALAAAGPAFLLMEAWGWPSVLRFEAYVQTIGAGALCWLAALVAMRHPFVRRGREIARARLAAIG